MIFIKQGCLLSQRTPPQPSQPNPLTPMYITQGSPTSLTYNHRHNMLNTHKRCISRPIVALDIHWPFECILYIYQKFSRCLHSRRVAYITFYSSYAFVSLKTVCAKHELSFAGQSPIDYISPIKYSTHI